MNMRNENFSEWCHNHIFGIWLIGFLIGWILGVIVLNRITTINDTEDGYHRFKSYEIYNETNKLVYDSIKLALLTEVDRYINSIAPSSSLSGLVLINNCLKYDIDILFVLAQAEQESHFGTQGLARKTNSVFNVFAFDGHDYDKINPNGKYEHPNDCIEPYMKLLKRDYLVDGKTEYDMFDQYVNKNGQRYASSELYEEALRKNYSKIKTNTRIEYLSQQLQKYKLILNR